MTSPGADETAQRVPEVGASDYLRSVLALVHQDEAAAVALTLAIPAGIAQGRAVHPAVWLRRMAAEVRARPGPDAGREGVARVFEAHAARRDDDRLPIGALMSSIKHVYLVDATLTPAAPTPPAGPRTLWQIALADVSAWTIGDPAPLA